MNVDLSEAERRQKILEAQGSFVPSLPQQQAPSAFMKHEFQYKYEAGGEEQQLPTQMHPGWRIERKKKRPSEHFTVETGTIFFFYRPKIDSPNCTSVNDVQRAYMLLVPDETDYAPSSPARLIVIPKKHLPAISSHERLWGLVDKVSHNLDELRNALLGRTYETKTRGTRQSHPARPVGRGVYSIVRDQPHTTHLCYVLSVPTKLGAPQRALGVRHEASYVLNIKSPRHPPAVGAPKSTHPPKYPRELDQAFGQYAWIGANPPQLLDYEGAEILLIGAHDTVADEAGTELEKMGLKLSKLLNPQAVLYELHTTAKQMPLDALEGHWA